MKDESVLIRYIKKKQGLLTTSGILATVSTVVQFIPFYCIYKIIELLMVGDYSAGRMFHWSLVSMGSVLVGVILLYASSMCSHVLPLIFCMKSEWIFCSICQRSQWAILRENPVVN
ncbi:hypothetical protein ABW365_18285 [Enterococcus avium]